MSNKFEGLRSTTPISNIANQLVEGLLKKQEALVVQQRDLYCANEGVPAECVEVVMHTTAHRVSVYSLKHGDKLIPLVEVYPPTYNIDAPLHSYTSTATVNYKLLYR